MTRNLKGQGLDEGASTRLLVHAAKLVVAGVEPVTACRSAIARALTDDADVLSAVNELCASLFKWSQRQRREVDFPLTRWHPAEGRGDRARAASRQPSEDEQ